MLQHVFLSLLTHPPIYRYIQLIAQPPQQLTRLFQVELKSALQRHNNNNQ